MTDNEHLIAIVLTRDICRERGLGIPALLESEATEATKKIAARNLSPSQIRELRQAMRETAANEVNGMEMLRQVDATGTGVGPFMVRL